MNMYSKLKSKLLLVAGFALAAAPPLHAQDLQVFASAGLASGDNAFTIGETFVAYQAQPSAVITEGFHQPTLGPSTALQSQRQDVLFGLSPNPASDITYLHVRGAIQEDFQATLYDLHGHILWSRSIHPGENLIEVPLHSLSQSMYFLRVEGATHHIFKVEKIGI
jgi:Secretion system C-terminal sorting domain